MSQEPLRPNSKPDNVRKVTVPNRRDRRSMSRRSGQSGSVYRKGSKYIGRYRADVPGQKRIRRYGYHRKHQPDHEAASRTMAGEVCRGARDQRCSLPCPFAIARLDLRSRSTWLDRSSPHRQQKTVVGPHLDPKGGEETSTSSQVVVN